MSLHLADVTAASAAALSDAELIDTQRTLADERRRVDAAAAVIASEIHTRSARELGYDGLAQRLGARTPEHLVQQLTGSTAREAQALVRVGSLPPWLAEVTRALNAARISIDAADAIRSGLGDPTDDISPKQLADAAATLLRETLTVEQLAARARELRAELRLAEVAHHEEDLRSRRYLRLIRQADGMTRLAGILDPESAALVTSAFDAATSPRRGGPRFVESTARDRAEKLSRDERTTEQIAVDAFVELLRLGGAADSTAIIGATRPAVRILVTDRDLRARRGLARIEGQPEALSIATAERHICNAGTVPVLFDGTRAIDVGRELRLYNTRQRIGLAARDGGCRFPGCDRPPSWCEAHHINEWARDHGRTDLADGVLLCRHHHLLVHNNGWRVTRDGGEYFVVPPPTRDPEQRPIAAPSKSAALRRLVATA